MEDKYNRFASTLLFALLAFLAVYGLLIFRSAPFTDETWDWTENVNAVYVAAGRFLISLYHEVFYTQGIPWAYGIASALFLSLALAWQTCIFKIEKRSLRLFYVAVCIGIPQLSYLMVCSHHVDSVCLGILLATCSFWLIDKVKNECVSDVKTLGVYAVAALLMAFAAGAYQFLIVFPGLFSVVSVLNEKTADTKYYANKLLRVFFVSLMAFGMYYVVALLFKLTVPDKTIVFCDNYQQSLVTWGKLSWDVHVLHIGKQWIMHLLGSAYPGEWFYATTLIPVLFLVVSSLLNNAITWGVKILRIGMVWGIYVAPFIAIVVLGEDQGARLHLFEPFACSLLWCVMLKEIKLFNNNEYGKILMCLVSAFVLLKAVYVVSDMTNQQNRYYEENVRLAMEVKQMALRTAVPNGVNVAELPIYVSGTYIGDDVVMQKYKSCVSGVSTPSFYPYVRIPQLYHISESGFSVDRVEKEFSTMSEYPHPSSCRYVEGKILVKLPKR